MLVGLPPVRRGLFLFCLLGKVDLSVVVGGGFRDGVGAVICVLGALALVLFPRLGPCRGASTELTLCVRFFNVRYQVFGFCLFPVDDVQGRLSGLGEVFGGLRVRAG